MGRIIQNLIYRLRADTKPLQNDLKQGEKQTKKFSVGSIAAFAAVGAGAIAAFSKIRATIKQSIQDYGRQVQAEESLRAAITASGESARDVLPQYQALASEIQAVTLQGDEATLELIALATAMGVTSDEMDETTKGAIGLSDAFGISADRALRGLTEAFDGNFSTLQRYIPALRTASSESEKLRIVQEAAANGFEVSQARAETAFGALVQYDNAVGDLREQLGQSVAEGIEPFVRTLTGFVTSIANATGETRRFRDIINSLNDSGGEVNASLDEQRATLAQLEEARDRIRRTGRERAGEELGEIERNIAALESSIERQRIRTQVLARYSKTSEEYQRILALEQRALDIQNDAIAESERRRIDALSTEERQIESLQEQIDEWANLRAEIVDTQGRASESYRSVQSLITSLVRDRDALIESVNQEEQEYINLEVAATRTYSVLTQSGQDYYDGLALLREQDKADDASTWREKLAIGMQSTQLLLGLAQDYFSALQTLNQAGLQNDLDRIDRELQATLEANGLLEETKLERLEREKAAAIEGGDEELAASLDREIRRTQLEEEAARERARVRYEAELEAWRLQKLSTLAQAAQAALNAFSSAASIPLIGWKIAPVAAAAAAAFGLARYQAVQQAKPTAPSFRTGGSFTVPPGFSNDSFPLPSAFVQSGERVSVETAEQQALDSIGSRQAMNIQVMFDGREVARTAANYINNGQVRIEVGA